MAPSHLGARLAVRSSRAVLSPCPRRFASMQASALTSPVTQDTVRLRFVRQLSSISTPEELATAIRSAHGTRRLEELAKSSECTPTLVGQLQSHILQWELQDVSVADLSKALWFIARAARVAQHDEASGQAPPSQQQTPQTQQAPPPPHAPHPTATTQLFRQAVPALYNRLGEFSTIDLVNILYAFSASSCYEPELYAAASEFLFEGLSQLPPSALADLAWAYASVGHYSDDDDFWEGLAEAALATLSSFGPRDLSQLLWSFGTIRHRHPPLLGAALEQMAEQLQRWPLSGIGHAMWAAAELGCAPEQVVERVGFHVSTRLRNLRTSTDALGGGGGGGAAARPGAPWSQEGYGVAADAAGLGGAALRAPAEPRGDVQGALVQLAWAFAQLGHMDEPLFREAFQALGSFPGDSFSEQQLACLWGAQMAACEMAHPMREPHPLLAVSIKTFMRLVTRTQPRHLLLPSHLQLHAFGAWAVDACAPRGAHAAFQSWRFRDPSLLTHDALAESVREAVVAAGLPAPRSVVTLDGQLQLPLAMQHHGMSVAWEPLAPSDCCRNAPYAPTGRALVRARALRYRGWRVAHVPFHEWAELLDAGAAVRSGYLMHKVAELGGEHPHGHIVDPASTP